MSVSARPDDALGPEMALAESIAEGADVLLVGLTTGDDGPQLAPANHTLDTATADALRAALVAVGASAGAESVARVAAPAGLGAGSVMAIGLGSPEESTDPDRLRNAAGTAARALRGAATVATTLSLLDSAAVAEGFFLGAYEFRQFKSADADPAKRPPRRLELIVADAGDDTERRALARATAVARAVATARDLVNTPPSHLYPAAFADRARDLGEAAGLHVEVLDESALVSGGYGGIVGVGKGSSRPPRLVRMSYRCAQGEAAPLVALVGKGVTFDTGGISIKPAANMENMTSDMAGAAAVVATVALAARLSLPVNVTATVPMAENMPSATAQRPGDVLTQYGGTTVEVLNTDAEGRLILADAIVRACEDGPDYLIDTATLTGAQLVALGSRTPGVMGTEEFRDRVAELSRRVGEYGWPMPLPTHLRADLDSKVADLANVTNHRFGGMLVAGLFLKEFVAEGVQWAHLDVAGPAYNTGGPFGYHGKGATGVPVRTMFAVLEDIAERG